MLPFTGEAYFNAELEAWVGLCSEWNGVGCFCACDVARIAAEFTSTPAWKLGQDRLFRKGPRLHLGAKLLYMGDSKFCLSVTPCTSSTWTRGAHGHAGVCSA